MDTLLKARHQGHAEDAGLKSPSARGPMAGVARLTLDEIRLLKPLARKLERLERGEFPADTDARCHFLQVCR